VVVLDRRLEPTPLERAHERLGGETAGEDLELHEEPPGRDLLLGAMLLHVDPRLVARAHRYPPRVCISRWGSRRSSAICTSGERCRTVSRSSAPRSVRACHGPVMSVASSASDAP